jgi:hypothetical protein
VLKDLSNEDTDFGALAVLGRMEFCVAIEVLFKPNRDREAELYDICLRQGT